MPSEKKELHCKTNVFRFNQNLKSAQCLNIYLIITVKEPNENKIFVIDLTVQCLSTKVVVSVFFSDVARLWWFYVYNAL